MSYRTAVPSTFEEYCAYNCNAVEEVASRDNRLSFFPYSVMLKLSFPELDYANRWCWLNLGPSSGECTQRDSEYCVCNRIETHSHDGKWMSYWFTKTDYNFGFNEWYFAESSDRNWFISIVDDINWGESYPKG